MIILGAVLFFLGFIVGIFALKIVGLILMAVGVIVWFLGKANHPVAGRRHWF